MEIKKTNPALTKIEKHEAICAERYKAIEKQLSRLELIEQSLVDLKVSFHQARGAVMALSILSIIIGIIYTLMRL